GIVNAEPPGERGDSIRPQAHFDCQAPRPGRMRPVALAAAFIIVAASTGRILRSVPDVLQSAERPDQDGQRLNRYRTGIRADRRQCARSPEEGRSYSVTAGALPFLSCKAAGDGDDTSPGSRGGYRAGRPSASGWARR